MTIAIGSLAWQILRLVSSIFLARILGLEQFGLAAMLLLAVGLIEMSSDVGLDKQLVQATDGDSENFLDTTHACAAVRGLVAGVIFLSLAYPTAWIFSLPEYAWAFALLSIVPICNGFSHLDRKRVQRQLRFGPDMCVEFIAQLGSVTVAILAAWWTRHFTAALWAILAQAFLGMIASFFVAERSYRWAWDVSTVRRLVSFGWPLLLSAFLVFITMHGERVLLASAPRLFTDRHYTAEDLGLFAAAGALAYAPVVIIGRLGLNLSLPLLAESKNTSPLFLRRFYRVSLLMVLCAATSVIAFLFLGSKMLELVYGAEYKDAYALLLALAISQAIRMVRVAPTVGALALGNSKISLWANILRSVGLGIAVLVLAYGWPIVWLAASGALAELWTLVFSIFYFRGLMRSGRDSTVLTERNATA